MNGALLYGVSIGVCAGVALAFLFGSVLPLAGGCLLLAIALLMPARKNRVLFIIAVVLCAVTLGLVRADIFLRAEMQTDLTSFAGEKTRVLGIVVNNPERRDTSLHTHIAVSEVGDVKIKGKLLAQLPRETQVSYGDRVVIFGRIEAPQSFETDTGRVFDYPGYLRARGISAVTRYAELKEREAGGPSLFGALFSLKRTFTNSLERVFAEPSGALLEGLLLGERRGLPQELTDAFIVSGLIHVVVLSGYNISIVAEGVLRALSYFPRAVGFGVGGAVMFFFVVMIGAGATAVRALIMGLIAIVARYFGRSAAALRALSLAAAAMVLWNPSTLLYDPSFMLSVLATFGLITLSPTVEEKLPKFLSHLPQVRSIAASTIAVQIFVLPALLYITGVFSLFALPANILVLPTVPFAMGFGFISGLLGFIHPVAALPAMVIADLLLRFMMVVATTVQSLPFSSAVLAAFPLWVAITVYIPLTALAVYLYQKGGAKQKAAERKRFV